MRRSRAGVDAGEIRGRQGPLRWPGKGPFAGRRGLRVLASLAQAGAARPSRHPGAWPELPGAAGKGAGQPRHGLFVGTGPAAGLKLLARSPG